MPILMLQAHSTGLWRDGCLNLVQGEEITETSFSPVHLLAHGN